MLYCAEYNHVEFQYELIPNPYQHSSTSAFLRSPALLNPRSFFTSSQDAERGGRECRLVHPKEVDHASVQLNVGHLDENGIYTNQFTTFALCGFVRSQGDADSALDRLWSKKKAELDCGDPVRCYPAFSRATCFVIMS
ncbi:hypothetical protein R1flu_015264 [Riccia fluitans]|uniref:Ribosomal protein S21e n=1 Tax=Riccia fluitans TaxID=41844 RepID=A0ABD1YIU1_9MARC